MVCRFVAGLLFATLASAAPHFDVTFTSAARAAPADGRLLLVIAARPVPEPRFQVGWDVGTAQVFGLDVEDWKPGDTIRIDERVTGYPLANLRDLRPGRYFVQAVLHVYETVHRADGHVLKLPMDDGEGQQWATSPGNLVSTPREIEIAGDGAIPIELARAIPPIPQPADTKYVRHVRFESKLLSKFWGRPVWLGAHVLVPPGFDENPSQRYPIVFEQGHFPTGFRQFRETPPGPELTGGARDAAQIGYRFYQDWSGGRLPKMLIVQTQHPTPYYDDSYGVNSANMGPYGDALTQEFYPYLEQHFHAIGEPWARLLYGGSTGGWMSLAQQVLYPEYFGGTWSFCPDPVDFHAFQTIDAYKDSNAFFDLGPFGRIVKPLGRLPDAKKKAFIRDALLPDGRLLATMESMTKLEAALGSKARSGGQMDAFHAVFGPVGPDGYPAKMWDPQTGEIAPEVAKYWREHFDLTEVLRRDWESRGPRLVGKIHITMGTKDTFYLDTSVTKMEQFLESTKMPGKGPYYGGSVEYGANKPHCWAGDIPPGQTLQQYYLPIFAFLEELEKSLKRWFFPASKSSAWQHAPVGRFVPRATARFR